MGVRLDRGARAGSWGRLLSRLLHVKDKHYLLRAEQEGAAPAVFRALGIRPPSPVEALPSGRTA